MPQSADPLEVKLVRNKIVLVDGKETAQSATIARPGEILEEIATYTNKSKSPIRKLEATLPIPPNTELLVASIKPGNAKASVDGRQFFALPLKRKVKQENGEKGVEIEQLIPLREYKYLRWYPGELGGEKVGGVFGQVQGFEWRHAGGNAGQEIASDRFGSWQLA